MSLPSLFIRIFSHECSHRCAVPPPDIYRILDPTASRRQTSGCLTPQNMITCSRCVFKCMTPRYASADDVDPFRLSYCRRTDHLAIPSSRPLPFSQTREPSFSRHLSFDSSSNPSFTPAVLSYALHSCFSSATRVSANPVCYCDSRMILIPKATFPPSE